MDPYPGTVQHQAVLKAILAHYENDPRVRAIVVFGSLGRGNWDAYSDIDLDIVIADAASIDVAKELEQLCASLSPLGERAAVILPDDDEGDVVLESLMQLSVRYHPLAQTSPNIVQSMKILAGELSYADIAAAGEANRRPASPSLQQLLGACVRYAAVTNVYLQREQVWLTVEILHRMRGLLMQIFARVRGEGRTPQTFEAEASEDLQARLGATLPQSDPHSLYHSLAGLLDILQNDLEHLANGQVQLTRAHQAVLARVRQQLAAGAKNEQG